MFNFERSNSRAKLTVRAALCGNGVILGPYFFDGNVNGMAYLQLLNEFAFPQLVVHFGNQHWEDMFWGLWWAQDGAPAHRLIEVKPGSHERHKHKQRKQRMNSPLRLAKTKQQEFFFVSPFVLLFAYAWTMILCL